MSRLSLATLVLLSLCVPGVCYSVEIITLGEDMAIAAEKHERSNAFGLRLQEQFCNELGLQVTLGPLGKRGFSVMLVGACPVPKRLVIAAYCREYLLTTDVESYRIEFFAKSVSKDLGNGNVETSNADSYFLVTETVLPPPPSPK